MIRRGQANVVSLMILISVTIALALLLYAYFAGIYSHQSTKQEMIEVAATYSTSITVAPEFYTNSTMSGGVRVYCNIVMVRNNGAEQLRFGIVGLPGTLGTQTFVFDSAIKYVPLDYSLTPPILKERIWLLEDVNGDGIVDMVGGSESSPHLVLNTTANCTTIYSNGSLKNSQLTPSYVEARNIIMDISNDYNMLEFIRQAFPDVPDDFLLPVWFFTLNPGESVTLYIYVESPVLLNSFTLAVIGSFSNTYLVGGFAPILTSAG